MNHVALLLCILIPTTLSAQIERRLPPVGIEIPNDVREKTETRSAELRAALNEVGKHPAAADAAVLLKAVEFAVQHREIYKPEHLKLLDETLTLAEQRIELLKAGQPDWHYDKLTVRGFYSRIDDSPQPYGLVIPEDLPKDKAVPLYVWLHGRGDKTTDIHFIRERLKKTGYVSPPGAMVLHPFGRQCIGYKSAGETDVLEAIEHVKANYNIDHDRVVLMGFSMGGAGAWHLGAHFTDQFVAVSPGAGFAETARYQKLTPEKIAATPSYERKLWSQYDVPGYVRNMFNAQVVCYSGEKDKQIQAARVMEEAFAAHYRKLDHIIGPGMGHKYDDTSLATIMEKMAAAVNQGRSRVPDKVHLQTRTLRYPKMHWVRIDRLEQHWEDSTVDAEIKNDTVWITTKNVQQLTLDPFPENAKRVVIDDVAIGIGESPAVLHKINDESDQWQLGPFKSKSPLAKRPGLQGPIDDAFVDRFVVVTPDEKTFDPGNQPIDKWIETELNHLRDRWSALFRGTLPEKRADKVTDDDIRDANLIIFGDSTNNSMIDRIVAKGNPFTMLKNPMSKITSEDVRGRGKSDGKFTLSLIYPNPLNPEKYVVFNSGPTFREAHDRTNSLQNPKLPDWVVYDFTVPPNAERAARVVGAGFFDETWSVKP